MTQPIANGHAWTLGKDILEKAITHKETFAFETTLGGNTITNLLIKAAEEGMKVKLWYAGLESVELNLARVKARVAQGGHNIPEADIRKRWNSSRRNLIKLLPHLHSLRINSHRITEGDCRLVLSLTKSEDRRRSIAFAAASLLRTVRSLLHSASSGIFAD